MSFDPTPMLSAAIFKAGCQGGLVALSKNGAIQTFSAGLLSGTDPSRPYYIYSISKSFTAVAIMKLCEEQGDFLDETFSSLLPETLIPDAITIRQLLNHTSGLSDYFSAREYQDAIRSHPNKPWSYEHLMEIGLRHTPLFPPGEGWAYSNPAYGLLRELIEQKSQMNYYAFLQKTILDPVGMPNTRAFLEPDFDLALLEGEDTSIKGDFRPQYSPGWIATGSLISTVSDVARFYDALFAGKIIPASSLDEMKKTVSVPYPLPPPTQASYGLGLMHSRNDPLGEAYGHGGGGPGYTTYARHYPALNGSPFTISLVLNKTLPTTPFDLADEIVRAYIMETQ